MNQPDRSRNYYEVLEVHLSASAIEIRRAYRESSKKYHPDTTKLATATAMAKFRELNEAYATLSNPERRAAYDRQIGYSRVLVIQPPSHFQPLAPRANQYRSSAYLDPNDRPLSGGELFALLMLVTSFIGCLVLAIGIGIARGELKWG